MRYIKLFFFSVFVLVVTSQYAQDKKYITYKVKPGETVQSIAKSLAITPYDLLKLNPDIKDQVVADQIIILGAHYDHLGQAPDGTLWKGANDDASGQQS